jgi:hypothetical protein
MRFVDPDDPSKELESIPLPPKFDKNDFVRGDYFSIRRKLNVSRERFIVFSDLSPHRFGWNGWHDRERALAQVEAFTFAESDPQKPLPVPTSEDTRRCGITFGLWESLPEVRRWGAADEHSELQALAREACRQQRCPCPIVDAWKSKEFTGKPASEAPNEDAAPKTKRAKAPKQEVITEVSAEASLAERAWVVSLFRVGKDLDAATVWSRHKSRLSEPPQSSLPGLGEPVQLKIAEVAAPRELASLDEARLILVLDDLVASGDLQVTGRGKKKRFQLVLRGVSS